MHSTTLKCQDPTKVNEDMHNRNRRSIIPSRLQLQGGEDREDQVDIPEDVDLKKKLLTRQARCCTLILVYVCAMQFVFTSGLYAQENSSDLEPEIVSYSTGKGDVFSILANLYRGVPTLQSAARGEFEVREDYDRRRAIEIKKHKDAMESYLVNQNGHQWLVLGKPLPLPRYDIDLKEFRNRSFSIVSNTGVSYSLNNEGRRLFGETSIRTFFGDIDVDSTLDRIKCPGRAAFCAQISILWERWSVEPDRARELRARYGEGGLQLGVTMEFRYDPASGEKLLALSRPRLLDSETEETVFTWGEDPLAATRIEGGVSEVRVGIRDLAWFNGTLFAADKATIVRYDENGSFVGRIPASFYGIAGLAADQSGMWVVVAFSGELYHLDYNNNLGQGFRTGIDSPRYAVSDGVNLWLGSEAKPLLYLVDSKGLIVRRITSPVDVSKREAGLGGLAWDGEALIVGESQADTLFRISPQDGEVLERLPAGFDIKRGGPGISWKGGCLWRATREGDPVCLPVGQP